MHLTADDFRSHFAGLSDEELVQVNREELVELARQCYDVELAHRGLNHAEPPDEAPAEEPPPSAVPEYQELVEVASFSPMTPEAQLAESLLRSQSIQCLLLDENMVRMGGPWANRDGGLRLMVPPADAERAREILQTPVSEAELEKEAESATDPPPEG